MRQTAAGEHGESVPSASELPELTALAARLRRQAPTGYICIFLNCEFHETTGGMTASDDLFAVVQHMFRPSRRHQWTLDADSLVLLNKAARRYMLSFDRDYVTLDFILYRAAHRVFVDSGPLRRIGGDYEFKSKHKAYVDLEPRLAGVA